MEDKSKQPDYPYIIFFKDSHTYWKNERRVPSVGSLLKKVIPPFEGSYWETHSIFKIIFEQEYIDHFRSFKEGMPDAESLYGPFMDRMTPEEFFEAKNRIRDIWGFKKINSQRNGTMFHDARELEAYERGFLLNPFTQVNYKVRVHEKFYDNQAICKNLYDLEDGAYLELLVFNRDGTLAGQADKVFIETIKRIRYIDIDDFKTGDKPSGKSRGKLYEPLEHIGNSKHNVYMLQINLYAKLLADHGFVPRNLAYTWYENYDPKKAHIKKFKYLAAEMNVLC